MPWGHPLFGIHNIQMHWQGLDRLQAGLQAEVLVPLYKRTALDYMVEPLFQTFWKSGREH